ncbi:hypothetical protein ASPACDRAFT_1890833 [Aspergillus aculeatus ATCC 16872]|uniref:Uncharacterized protein n=1 Tax=Aspergillus aculeatus (strain ATCC 16872 / CBS 172.66 / WB 5094) TaxID=690307 RepID=A0A1L9WJS3_ASPA1|nr:uncharacterized protein ASPACDRAFT_1890833 [Aspergillus aculeatus ATCC 16872]OJJ96410.1 hypothetical protein ASPACDRAFT_1890833 [Aspergillus aculeatus ATCC 16872]
MFKRAQAESVLYVVGLVGMLGTWGRSALDGSTALLLRALDGSKPYILPGTEATLRRNFTGIRYPLDCTLSVLVAFWYEAIDGSHPAASAVSLYFLGQLLPCIVIAYVNGLRGQKPSLLKYVHHPALMSVDDGCTIGSTGFLWALNYITTSHTVRPPKQTHLSILQHFSAISSFAPLVNHLLFPAIVLSYLVPAALMTLPVASTISNSSNFHQLAIVAWNIYPLLTLASLYTLRPFLKLIAPAGTTQTTPATSKKNEAHIHAIRAATIPALLFSTLMHISTASVSITTVLFPTLFQPIYHNELHPTAIFIPPLAIGPQAKSPGDGVRGFLLWDQVAGYSTVMIVVMLELRSAWAAKGWDFRWQRMIPVALGGSLLLGPGSACLLGSWVRDEVLFGGWGQEDKQVRKVE